MWPWLARHLICPLHERMLGRPTFRHWRALEASQWWSPDDLLAHQTARLAELLQHADRTCVYYRRRMLAAGFDPVRDDPWEGLRRIAPTTKDDMREQRREMLWRQAPGGLFRHTTGGSSGEPLIFYFDRRRQACDQAARIRTHRWFGADIGDRELYLWGSPIEFSRTDRVKSLRDRLFNHRLLSAFDMSPARMDEYLDDMRRYRPACLFGYPSSLATLARHALDRHRPVAMRSLRAVFVTGEVCTPADRRVLESAFEVPVADCYGSRDGGFIAHQCPEGAYHLTAENVIVEIMRGDEVLPIGETGEIVLTHLDNYAMPFIRYRTGDVSRLLPGRCRCGRGLPLLDAVAGRETDAIHLPDGTVKHALAVVYPLREMDAVRRFRVTQQADYSVDAEVVPAADAATSGLQPVTIVESLRRVLGHEVPVRVRFVADIPVSGSGKFRHVQSRVSVNSPADLLLPDSTGGDPASAEVVHA